MKLAFTLQRRLPLLIAMVCISFLAMLVAFESWIAAAGVVVFWSAVLFGMTKADLEGRAFRAFVFFVSYSVAVFGAFLISLCLFMPLLIFGAIAGSLGWSAYFAHSITGFFAVFLPSFCLPQASRWFVALVLLLGGCSLYYLSALGEDISVLVQRQTFHAGWLHFSSLVLAGSVAVAIHWLRRNRSERICPNVSVKWK